jgi:hypothetical protein
MSRYPDFPVERATFERHRDRLLPDHEGRYVIILGDDLVATTDTLEEALDVGFERAGGPGFFTARLTSGPQFTVLPAAIVWTP